MTPADSLSLFATWAGHAIEAIALAWLTLGIAFSLLSGAWRWLGERDPSIYHPLRRQLAHVTLFGLELLVAADIVQTVAVRPTFASLGVLGLVVLIRTFLSFALEVETEGRWPWQRPNESE